MTHEEVHDQLMRIWSVMDDCIRNGVSTTEEVLPGRVQLARRAPKLYQWRILHPSYMICQRLMNCAGD